MIDLRNLCIQQGDFALQNVNLKIEKGAYGVLMGRSGSGKTTIMENVCGLRRAQSGTIWLDRVNVTSLQPGERNIGYVPQDGALFPTMSVRHQVGFALAVRRVPAKQICDRVDELSDLLGIAHLLDRKPQGLSGGETQRVALGRALATRPGILCLDEPLSSLDDDSRAEMIVLLQSLRAEMPMTCLHITHHQHEANELASERFAIADGQVQRVA